jgi:hypothetical protein
VQDRSASQAVQRAASLGDRARRVARTMRVIERIAPTAAAVAVIASGIAAVLGGLRMIGLVWLGASAIAAALAWVAARRTRPVSGATVGELDRAAGLDGALHSAYWFAGADVSTRQGDPRAPWVRFHLQQTATRTEGIDWTAVYARPFARRAWSTAAALTLVALGLMVWPSARLLTRTAGPTSSPNGTAQTRIPASLVPNVIEGIRAMHAGGTPSKVQLSAIGQTLEIAKIDPNVQKQIEALLARAAADPRNADAGQDADSDRDPRDVYSNDIQLNDLSWAYQEAVARSRGGERAHPDSSSASTSEGTPDGKPGEREADPAAAGSPNAVPVLADTRGQPVGFLSQLLGRQQASGEPGSADHSQNQARAGTLTAALRAEIVRARTDLNVPELDTPAARRATNAGRTPAGAYLVDNGVRYDRSHGGQPPPVPDARRSLVHDFFLRAADAGSPVKRP